MRAYVKDSSEKYAFVAKKHPKDYRLDGRASEAEAEERIQVVTQLLGGHISEWKAARSARTVVDVGC